MVIFFFSLNKCAAPLIEAIFLEFSRLLINMGLKQAALYYGQMAGEKGQLLLKEVDILFS